MTRAIRITASVELVTETCCDCGILFAITSDLRNRLLKIPAGKTRGPSFFCPAGHSQSYVGESETDKMRRERDRAVQQLARSQDDEREANRRAEEERRRAIAFKGQATRLRNRAKAGVCPCCNRHFSALERHMANKHPGFVGEAPELTIVQGGKAA